MHIEESKADKATRDGTEHSCDYTITRVDEGSGKKKQIREANTGASRGGRSVRDKSLTWEEKERM